MVIRFFAEVFKQRLEKGPGENYKAVGFSNSKHDARSK